MAERWNAGYTTPKRGGRTATDTRLALHSCHSPVPRVNPRPISGKPRFRAFDSDGGTGSGSAHSPIPDALVSTSSRITSPGAYFLYHQHQPYLTTVGFGLTFRHYHRGNGEGEMSNDQPIKRRLLNIHEVAEYTGVSIHTISTMVSRRRIAFVKVGQLTKFDLSAVDAWIDKQSFRPKA